MNEFEKHVFEVLVKKYPGPEWIVLPQVRISTGHKHPLGGGRYIDIFVINTFPSKDFKCIAIEIKKTIEDYRSDIGNIKKQLAARFYSDEFYYLFPEEVWLKYEAELCLIFKEEKCTGFMVMKENSIRIARQCARQQKNPYSMGFVCSLLRQALKY